MTKRVHQICESIAAAVLLMCVIVSQVEAQQVFDVSEVLATPHVIVSDSCGTSMAVAAQSIVVKKSVLGCLESIQVLPQDEVWLINARACPDGETDLSFLETCQLRDGDFQTSSLNELTDAHRDDKTKSTVLYVHGNQTNLEFAIARGMQVYRNAFTTRPACRGPIRYVIWAWKSEQELTRLYPDYLVKSKRSVAAGETLVATLNRFSDRNMVLFGYSLGVQVVISALDSPLKDLRLDDPTRYRVACVAPAINPEYVARNSLRADSASPAASTFVFTNRKDRAIRAAQAIIRRKAPVDEATIEGLSSSGKLNMGPVSTFDISKEAGRFHAIERYTRSATMQRKLAELVNDVLVTHASHVLPARSIVAQADSTSLLTIESGE